MPEMSPEEVQELQDYLNEKSMQFTTLAAERHQAGAEEYGAITFLENDVIRMMLEELADTANYCRMQAIKLLILQERLESDGRIIGVAMNDAGPGDTIEVELGAQAFKGTKNVGWKR
jgi:hypothetical protein